MKKRVEILCGVSGSGKSTFIKTMTGSIHPTSFRVCSADDVHIVEGRYRFDGTKLQEGHQNSLRSFLEALLDKQHVLVLVDNTNCSAREVAPYADLALALGADLVTTVLLCDPVFAYERNTHCTPLETILRRDQLLRSEWIRWPRDWNVQVRFTDRVKWKSP